MEAGGILLTVVDYWVFRQNVERGPGLSCVMNKDTSASRGSGMGGRRVGHERYFWTLQEFQHWVSGLLKMGLTEG